MRPKYREPEGAGAAASSSEEEEDTRFVDASQARGILVFSDSLLRLTEPALAGNYNFKYIHIDGGAGIDRVSVNIKSYVRDNPGPHVVVICVGSNDIFPFRDYSIPPTENFSHEEAGERMHIINDPLTAKRRDLVVWLTARHCQVVFCTVPPRNNLHVGDVRTFLRYNCLIREENLSRGQPTPDIEAVVSRYRWSRQERRELFYYARPNRLMGDGIHPTQETADKWAEEIERLIVPLC